MREVIDAPLIDNIRCGVVHDLQVFQNHLLALFIRNFFHILMLAERISRDDLILGISPATIVNHQMSETLRHHVVKYIVGNLRMILRLGLHGQNIVTLIINLGEEFLLIFAGIEVLDHALLSVCALVRNIQRSSHDDLVIFFHISVDGDKYFSISSLDFFNRAVQTGGMFQMVIQLFPDVLCSVLPGPQIDLDKVHAGLEIQILQNVSGRNLVEIAVAERGERPDPDILDKFNTVLFAELIERKRQIFQVRVLSADRLTLCALLGETVITAFRNSAVSVDVISFVFGFQQLAELFHLVLHSQKTRDLKKILLRLERLDDFALTVLVVSVQFGTVVCDAAEFFRVMHRVIAGNAHDGAHLIAASVICRGPALTAYAVEPLQNRIVFIAFLLQVHTCRQSGGTASNNADAGVFVHLNDLRFYCIFTLTDIIQHIPSFCICYF